MSQRLSPGAAFSGRTALWLHGIRVLPYDPIEATVPLSSGVYARSGMRIRRADVPQGDLISLRGVVATSLVTTIAELCGRLTLVDAVVVADAALHSKRNLAPQLNELAGSRRGRGAARLRRVMSLAEPETESPMESRLRMVLVLGGLPRPNAQVRINDGQGRFAGRPDLYYESARLGIEYDGAVHRDSLVEDDQRQNKLLRAGVRLLRFTATSLASLNRSLPRSGRC